MTEEYFNPDALSKAFTVLENSPAGSYIKDIVHHNGYTTFTIVEPAEQPSNKSLDEK